MPIEVSWVKRKFSESCFWCWILWIQWEESLIGNSENCWGCWLVCRLIWYTYCRFLAFWSFCGIMHQNSILKLWRFAKIFQTIKDCPLKHQSHSQPSHMPYESEVIKKFADSNNQQQFLDHYLTYFKFDKHLHHQKILKIFQCIEIRA